MSNAVRFVRFRHVLDVVFALCLLRSAGAQDLPDPKVEEVGKPLPEEVPGKLITDFKIRTLGTNRLRPCACLSKEEDALLLLDETGAIRRIEIVSMTEQRRLNLGVNGSWMELSSEGLVVSSYAADKIWLIDPNSLEVKWNCDIAKPSSLGTSPGSQQVYVAHSDFGNQLAIVDLKKQRVVQDWKKDMWIAKALKAKRHADCNGPGTFGELIVSADGKTLVFASEGSLNRAEVKPNDLVFEETGPRLSGTLLWPVMSTDGKFVSFHGSPSRDIAGHPTLRPSGFYVYKLQDFQKPQTSIVLDHDASTLAIARGARRFFAVVDEQLRILDQKGNEIGRKRGCGEAFQCFLIDDEKRILVLSPRGLCDSPVE